MPTLTPSALLPPARRLWLAGARYLWLAAFMGAAILAAGLLIKIGAPIVPVAVAIAATAFLQWRRRRTSGAAPRGSR